MHKATNKIFQNLCQQTKCPTRIRQTGSIRLFLVTNYKKRATPKSAQPFFDEAQHLSIGLTDHSVGHHFGGGLSRARLMVVLNG